MRVPFYDVKAQYDELAHEMESTVLDVMRSGGYVLGKHNKAFEAEFAALHQTKHAIAVHSGTDALRIIMDAAGVGPGDEVITTPFTFVASVETIVQTGATPVFVDIDPRTFNLDVAKVRAAITPRTKAILPVHLFGQLVDVKPLMELACERELIILEDAAQAIESTHEGKPAGNFSVAAGFSFYVTKNLGAAGDGGMIVTNYDDIAERCRSIRIHGMGRERYYYDHLGYTARLDEIQAAVLRVKLPKLPEWTARRAEFAAIYFEELEGLDLQLPYTLPGNNHTYHQFNILSDRRDALQAFLKEREIDSMTYYPVPIHHHSPYLKFAPEGSEDRANGPLAITERVSNEILALPIHPHLNKDQIRHVCASITEFAQSTVGA